jgi:hypothetical protein
VKALFRTFSTSALLSVCGPFSVLASTFCAAASTPGCSLPSIARLRTCGRESATRTHCVSAAPLRRLPAQAQQAHHLLHVIPGACGQDLVQHLRVLGRDACDHGSHALNRAAIRQRSELVALARAHAA